MNPLSLFYQNEVEREAVREFFIKNLEEMAVERVFDKQSVAGIYEARKVITRSFDKLDELFGKPKVQKTFNSR
jgi:hypothetical protein